MPSRLRGALKNLTLLIAATGISLVLGEVVVRAAGRHPFTPVIPNIRVEPGGHLNLAHPVLGYTYAPGRYHVTFDNGDAWTTTHLADTLRITRPLASYDRPWEGPSLWLFGCSFVHGWGLDDQDTLGYKLHERLPAYDVVNFGVGGYNTVQSLFQFRQALNHRATPAIVVLAYAGFHDERNALLRHWRRGTFEYESLGTAAAPYARLDASGALRFRFERPRYTAFELIKHSVLAEMADEAYMDVEEHTAHCHRVSELLVDVFAAEAQQHGVRFLLAGISQEPETEAMEAYARARGIVTLDIAQTLKGRNRIRWDGHPSGRANRLSAQKLADFLRDLGA